MYHMMIYMLALNCEDCWQTFKRFSLRLCVCLSIKTEYQVSLGDHAGEFLLRIEHRNMVMAISGE